MSVSHSRFQSSTLLPSVYLVTPTFYLTFFDTSLSPLSFFPYFLSPPRPSFPSPLLSIFLSFIVLCAFLPFGVPSSSSAYPLYKQYDSSYSFIYSFQSNSFSFPFTSPSVFAWTPQGNPSSYFYSCWCERICDAALLLSKLSANIG